MKGNWIFNYTVYAETVDEKKFHQTVEVHLNATTEEEAEEIARVLWKNRSYENLPSKGQLLPTDNLGFSNPKIIYVKKLNLS